MKIKIIVIKKVQSWKKIHRSMKRGKMIKIIATGTGARKVVIGWLFCLGASGFLLQALLQASVEKPGPRRFSAALLELKECGEVGTRNVETFAS